MVCIYVNIIEVFFSLFFFFFKTCFMVESENYNIITEKVIFEQRPIGDRGVSY